MGAWSHKPFGNDDANDWAYDLEDRKDLTYIEETLDKVLDEDNYLEAPEGSAGVAAVEVIAKLLGKGTQSDAYTEKVDAWVRSVSLTPSPALLDKAQRSLKRILGKNSELKELWEDSGNKEWEASIKSLLNIVSSP